MAKMEVKLPDELAEKLARLGDRTDEIVPKVLEAGGEVMLTRVRSNLNSVLSGNSTGQLERSLGVSPAKLDRNGNFNIKIGFAETRRRASAGNSVVTNAMLANILEYGKHNQPPRPFMKPAKSQSKNAAITAMERKFNEETEGL